MNLLNDFYDSSVSIPLSLMALAVISLLSWRKRGHQIILVLTLLLYVRYLAWRGLYTLNSGDGTSLLVSWTVYTAELYAFIQGVLFAYHAWSPLERKPVPLKGYPTVDIFVTVVDEPLGILHRTLIGCVNQKYPKDRYRVYVLDDGRRDEIERLAASLSCGYIRRTERLHAKAGNLNHALQCTDGEIVTIFDVDHVPTTDFLHDTVGFFQDERVAFVQTPHHFYNPDIFQKNLQVEEVLKNEQALFYRVLQSGRDRHNSAFFAGSCGLFRRRVLEEIGGFRTETVTEDIHTSMVIHAKGYRSCYLNKVLAAGLMPETFESSMKQRLRWATGHVQILFQSNPWTMHGLSLSQRIGYFASIFYFLHGVPRLICLIAPLFALLLGIIPVTADVPDLVNFFGSYYVAVLMMLRTVSRGTRNALWSDIYETAGCVALAWAAFSTAIRPWKRRPFVITQKGVMQERKGFPRFSYVVPHLVMLGLLVAGLATGIRLWMEGRPVLGLEVSLFWGVVNLVLIGVAILAAAEVPEWRKIFRIKRRLPCELILGTERFQGLVMNLNETGALVRVNKRFLSEEDQVVCIIKNQADDHITVHGEVRRHAAISPNAVEVGLKFLDVDQKTAESLIVAAFADPRLWNRPEDDPGIWRSLWSVLRVYKKLFQRFRTSRRYELRIPCRERCRLIAGSRMLDGTIEQVSETGLLMTVQGTADYVAEHGTLLVEKAQLKVRRCWVRQSGQTVLAGFLVERVDGGVHQWRNFYQQAA
jgi:cellulose synthase (UDP-forming)